MAVYTRAALGESYLDHDANPFQLMIEAEQIDQSLFESLIEVDFATVYNEAGIITLTEADKEAADNAQKEGFLKKGFELIKKLGAAIEQIFNNLISYIGNFISNDKKIVEKYGKYFNNRSNFQACEVKGTYVNAAYVKNMQSTFRNALNTNYVDYDVYDDDTDDVSTAHDTIKVDKKDKQGKYVLDLKQVRSNSGDKKIVDAMSEEDWKFMVDTMNQGYKSIMADVKAEKKASIERVKAAQKLLKADKKTSDEANKKYKEAIKVAKDTKIVASRYQALMSNAVFNVRVCYLKLAKWAAKKYGEKVPETSVTGNMKAENKFESDVTSEATDMLIELECMTYSDHVYEQILFN